MEIISKSRLNQIRASAEGKRPLGWLNEAVQAKARRPRTGEVTVFLSHKHDELKELKDAIALLEDAGVSVYVDWMDESMPTSTSGATATKIKSKINECHKFVLLATEAAIASKWCNWELGFGDAKKYIAHIAILPVKNDDRNFSGAEYLQIYPAIGEASKLRFRTGFSVQYPDGKEIDLADWLRA
jgi:hypothetical protein